MQHTTTREDLPHVRVETQEVKTSVEAIKTLIAKKDIAALTPIHWLIGIAAVSLVAAILRTLL